MSFKHCSCAPTKKICSLSTVVSLSLAVTLVAASLAATSHAHAGLLGNSPDGVLYDVDINTGLASNPRATGINILIGITFDSDGTLYGLTTFGSTPANSLVSIDPDTGAFTTIGPTGLSNIFEGDLDFDPTTGVLYGIQNVPSANARHLFTIDVSTGSATTVGNINSLGDLSAMTFDVDGTLLILDSSLEQLLTVNKSTAAIIDSSNLSDSLGDVAGMDFDPSTGVLYVADGFNDGTDSLYTLNPADGTLTLVGSTVLGDGLAGLAFTPIPVPEPASFWLALIATMGFGHQLRGSRARKCTNNK